MIADSYDEVGDLIARPRAGVVWGVAGSVALLLCLTALDGVVGLEPWLSDIGQFVLRGSGHRTEVLLAVGMAVHLLTGGVFGALYAACQQRTVFSGLMVVGGFYGFVLWLGSDLVLRRWLHVGPSSFRSWTGLGLLLTYGLGLALCAAATQARTARRQRSVKPVD